MKPSDWLDILMKWTAMVAAAVLCGLLLGSLIGCVSLHSDAVTQDHWNACQRYCAPGNIKEACDGWLGAGCKCTDGRTVWFEIEDFEDE